MTPLSSFFDLRRKRSGLSAVGFYVASFIATAILGGIVAGVAVLFVPGTGSFEQGFAFGVQVGTIVAAISSALLCLLVVWKKKFLPHPGMLALVVCSAALGYLGGALLGMIIPSFLTTKTAKAV